MNSKMVNLVIGLAITIIISVLLLLGLKIFIPVPQSPTYSNNCYSYYNDDKCSQSDKDQRKNEEEQYRNDIKSYSGNIFIAANIMGLIILILGIITFSFNLGTNIGVGIILAGAFGIIYGYLMGWEGADDKLKFFIGLIVAIIVIAGGIVVNRMKDQTTEVLK